jgi:beta-galactosidase/beta-glucuronidase
LHFEASDWRTRIYINGNLVGVHKGGYDPFVLDITNDLVEDGPQQLIVNVWDPGNRKPIARGKQDDRAFNHPQAITYSPTSGLWQTVWLEPVSSNYIKNIHIVPDIDLNEVVVTVYPESRRSHQTVNLTIRDGKKVVARKKGPIGQPIRLRLPHEKLWWPSRPFLYDLQVSFTQNGKKMDKVDSYFGMRKISIGKVDGNQRILLNNRFVFEMGPLDQGFWPAGIYTAPTDEALRWDLAEMKKWGFNMVRKHVKVEPRRWYYWADKLGLLVWQDMPSTFGMRNEQERTQFELEMERMIKKHWNHPSIVMWIPFNEHWGIYDAERIARDVKSLDPSRLVDANTGLNVGSPDY